MKGMSIIVPIYNAEKYLAETLNSLLSQTYKDWECILVNDGSTDDSLAICEQYKEKDNRFVVLTKPNEKSADLARAYGIERARTAWIIPLDADDIIEPTYIEKMVTRQHETGADIVSPTMVFCEHELEGEIWRLPCEPILYEDVLSGSEACAYTIGGWYLTTNGMLYRVELNTGITRGHYMNSDEFSSRQILFKASKVVFSKAKYIYRQHTNSISRNLSARLWERLIVNRQIEDFVFEHYPENENVKRSIVSVVFFKQVALTAAAWLEVKRIDKVSRTRIRNSVLQAYDNMNKKHVKTYLPKHSQLFLQGKIVFIIMSILYMLYKRIQCKKVEL